MEIYTVALPFQSLVNSLLYQLHRHIIVRSLFEEINLEMGVAAAETPGGYEVLISDT